ncbi:MAG: hypothetical protein ACLQIB_31395 [Isosphaeraceae bacterium]
MRFLFILHPSSFILSGLRLAAAVMALALVGCSDAADRLVVATWWQLDDRVPLEAAFRQWLASSGRDLARHPLELEWRLVSDWDDWQRELARRHPPDVLLGGRVESLDRLAQSGRLTAVRKDAAKPWLLIRSGEIRLADRSGRAAGQSELPHSRARAGMGGSGAVEATAARDVTFDDPRVDPLSRAWVASLLDIEHFRAGYARLVSCAGSRRRLGRRLGAARGAVERGEADLCPLWIKDRDGAEVGRQARRMNGGRAGGDRDGLHEGAVPPRLVEGAAIVTGGANERLAGEFLRFLEQKYPDGPAAATIAAGSRADPQIEDLVADLVGATLIDAQDELWAARAALDRSGDPEPALTWMTQPPPWPPASIARLLARGGSDGLNLMQALAQEIAPDAAVRAELIRSWLAPARVIDRGVLADLNRLADGRLATEPRFRAWLRAEWTVWARQRFRRVERLALARHSAAAAPERPSKKP